MSRKPITKYVGGKGSRQYIWEAIRKLGAAEGVFTEAQVWHEMNEKVRREVELGTVRDYRRGLVAAGILEVLTPAKSNRVPATFRLAKDEGIEAPRVRKDGTRVTQGLAQEQMWRTLRTLKGDTNARELAAYASTQTIPVSEAAAKDYLKNLYLASYLKCTVENTWNGPGRNKPARYRLISDTGPRPPMVQRTDAIYDPNLNAVVWIKPIDEETCIYGH